MTDEKKPDNSGSAPDDGVTPDSPADESQAPADQGDSQTPKDVAASSSENDQTPQPSLLDDIEQALVNESGKPLEDKPEVKPKEEGAKPEPEEGKKPAEDEKAKADDKPETEEEKAKKLHEVPEDVKEGSKAHVRFQELVSSNKQLAAEKEQFAGQVQSMRELISETGVNKDEFADLLDFAKEVKSGDPKKALEMLDRQRNDLILKIGENISPPDILDGFPDLKTKVKDGELAVDDAVRLAKSQNLEAQTKREKEQAEKTQEDQRVYEEQVTTNRNAVIALEKAWRENDLDWAVKRDLLQEKMPEINKRPPHEWPQLVEDAYNLITRTIKAAGAPAKKLTPGSPIGKGGTDGNGKQEPKTLMEAIALENNWT